MKKWRPEDKPGLVGFSILISASSHLTTPHLSLRPWQLAWWEPRGTCPQLLSQPVLGKVPSCSPVWPRISQRLWLLWPFLGSEEVHVMGQEIWLSQQLPHLEVLYCAAHLDRKQKRTRTWIFLSSTHWSSEAHWFHITFLEMFVCVVKQLTRSSCGAMAGSVMYQEAWAWIPSHTTWCDFFPYWVCYVLCWNKLWLWLCCLGGNEPCEPF